jgi:hypothetical protein
MISAIINDLMTIWGIIVLLIAVLAGLVVWFEEPWQPTYPDQLLCPLCSREMHSDWFTPRGCCCDCDEEMSALAATTPLTKLNPNLLWSAGRSQHNRNPGSVHASDAPACAGPRPAQRFYVW